MEILNIQLRLEHFIEDMGQTLPIPLKIRMLRKVYINIFLCVEKLLIDDANIA